MDDLHAASRPPRDVWVESLLALGDWLRRHPIPPSVVEAAIRENPWFTPYYLRRSVAGIAQWLEEKALLRFLADYPVRTAPPREVGIIAAGNLPLVGWHDVLMGLLSGHRVWLRCSHQDQIMIHWLNDQWKRFLPDLTIFLRVINDISSVDCLIATGSNNSARYFERRFRGVPKLIRHHRYSVAYLHQEVEDQQLDDLCDDLLLYNGLGCRNVSNVLLAPGFEPERLIQSLRAYPRERLNPLYLERVLYAKHLKGILGKTVIHTPTALLQPASEPGSSEMGVIGLIQDVDTRLLATWKDKFQHQWQCVVGENVTFGRTQQPRLSDFADNVDTMKLLLAL